MGIYRLTIFLPLLDIYTTYISNSPESASRCHFSLFRYLVIPTRLKTRWCSRMGPGSLSRYSAGGLASTRAVSNVDRANEHSRRQMTSPPRRGLQRPRSSQSKYVLTFRGDLTNPPVSFKESTLAATALPLMESHPDFTAPRGSVVAAWHPLWSWSTVMWNWIDSPSVFTH